VHDTKCSKTGVHLCVCNDIVEAVYTLLVNLAKSKSKLRNNTLIIIFLKLKVNLFCILKTEISVIR